MVYFPFTIGVPVPFNGFAFSFTPSNPLHLINIISHLESNRLQYFFILNSSFLISVEGEKCNRLKRDQNTKHCETIISLGIFPLHINL